MRITGQLIDARSGAHLWADRFDGSLEDVFELQDKVASSVAGVIEPALQAAETAPLVQPPTNDLTAYDLYLRAYLGLVVGSADSSRRCVFWSRRSRAIRVTGPRSPGPRSATFGCSGRAGAEDPAADRRKGIDLARRALEVAGDDPDVLGNAALALAYFGEDIGAMIGAGRPGTGAQPELRPRLAT